MSAYGYSVEVEEGYDEAVLRSRLALRAEGFSIITEAHVGEALGAGPGRDRQYLILGAWAPAVEERVLGSDVHVAVHFPCNFVVQETGATALVAALDPAEDLEDDAGPEALAARDARAALQRVLARLSAPGET
jgi:uncharacterized protein (DUF302 family)